MNNELTVAERCAIAEEMAKPDFIEKYAAMKRRLQALESGNDAVQGPSSSSDSCAEPIEKTPRSMG